MLTSFALCRQVQLLRAPEHSSPVTSRRRSHFTPVLFSIWLFQSPCSLFCHGPWVGKCDAKVPFVLSTGTILCPWISCEFLHYPQIISGSRCGYPYTIYATILPTGISSHTSRAQGSQLGKPRDHFSSPVACMAPSSTNEDYPNRDETSWLLPTWFLHVLLFQCMISSETEHAFHLPLP